MENNIEKKEQVEKPEEQSTEEKTPTLSLEQMEILAKHFAVPLEELGAYITDHLGKEREKADEEAAQEAEEKKSARSMIPSLGGKAL